MRGIQINNYFNNHITLNGKKINQEPHPLLQTIKPKPINQFAAQPDHNFLENRSPPTKSAQLPPKKRTNTLVELKKQFPSKRSISTERQRNAVSAKKKEDPPSEQSEKEEDQLVNMSHRKLKPSSSRGGLGKRSKSTIIKSHQPQVQRQLPKKDSKKNNSNPTVESVKPKTKRKKSSKIMQPFKESRTAVKPTLMKKQIVPAFSKEVPKKEKLNIKLDKAESKGDKKSARNHIGTKSTLTNRAKNSKPVSAREKKSKKSRFIEELKEKYQNQTILQGDLTNRPKDNDQNVDTEFLTVMNSLQKVLNSVGSKKKLKKQLQLISEKLRGFQLESEKADSEQNQEKVQERLNEDCSAMMHPLQQFEEESSLDSEDGHIEKQQKKRQEYSRSEDEEYKLRQLIDHQCEEMQESLQQQIRNPLIGKRRNEFIFDQLQGQNIEAENDRKKEIELLKQFRSESNKMMQKAGLPLQQKQPQEEQLQSHEYSYPSNKQRKELMINNVSGLSIAGHFEDKYPVASCKSPKFDENQLLGMITLKEQFASNKHNKMSELVKKMFEKQLVSPKSYEFQLRTLDKKYEQENKIVESLKKQAEQMSSMLSEIKKDKEEIKNIDDLIRNQQWQEAQKLVHKEEPKPQEEELQEQPQEEELQEQPQEEELQEEIQEKPIEEKDTKALDLKLSSEWDHDAGWQRVQAKKSEIEGNQFVDYRQVANRIRKNAQVRIDIDEECGGTEESIELDQKCNNESEDEYIYYNEDNDNEEQIEEGGLIRLVEVSIEQRDESSQEKTNRGPIFNDQVMHIENEQLKQKSLQASIIDKNPSNVSAASQQSERKGFTTNLYFIKEYCIALCEFVRDNDIFKTQFKNNVLKPLQFNLLDLMKDLKEEQLSPFFYKKRQNKNAISELVWNEFNAQYESLKCNANKGKTSEHYVLEREQELIFVRMIYDVLNQSIDYERPGGLFGKALPWKENAKHLKNLKQLAKPQRDNLQAYDLMFGVAIARIIQWGSCLCGFLPDTVQLQNTEIDQSYVNHIRETRMAFLLQKMMAEQQTSMSNFQMQQTEIYFRVANLISEQLLAEASQEMECLLVDQTV